MLFDRLLVGLAPRRLSLALIIVATGSVDVAQAASTPQFAACGGAKLSTLPASPAAIKLSPPVVAPGGVAQVYGSRFAPLAPVTVLVCGKTAGTFTPGKDGSFEGKIIAFDGLADGMAQTQAVQAESKITAGGAFEVQSDWPQYGYNNAKSSYNAHESFLRLSVVPTLSERWSVTIDPDMPRAMFGSQSAAVVGGVAYSGGGRKVLAVSVSDGAVVWRSPNLGGFHFTAGSMLGSSPVVADGMLYIGTADGLYAIRTSNGSIAWQYPGTVRGSPAVASGRVFFGSEHLFYALTTDGRAAWSVNIGRVDGSPAIGTYLARDGGVLPAVYISGSTPRGDARLFAFDGFTGRELWHFDPPGPSLQEDLAPVVVGGTGGMVLLSSGHYGERIYAVEAASGRFLWNTINRYESRSYGHADRIFRQPTVVGNALYVVELGEHNWDSTIGQWTIPPVSTAPTRLVETNNRGLFDVTPSDLVIANDAILICAVGMLRAYTLDLAPVYDWHTLSGVPCNAGGPLVAVNGSLILAGGNGIVRLGTLPPRP